uniref:NADH-ubiquinone oxidoreductase chain 5 n=1 Tax=Ceraclea indistincta TaxID=2904887 RepID=A0A9E8LNR4_9NEOP|nr:NADH dehydrogenase subunit 5 [Ceraclea indistincta]UZZ43825.1 NADH dehydrogenase subunit 5 [Ceraclea indistincta]
MYMLFSLNLFFISLLMFSLSLISYNKNYSLFLEWEMFSMNSMEFTYILLFDWFSFIFMATVMLISSMVILYSYSYMMEDCNKIRFLYLVVLFVASMMLMIISPNLFSILLGWDGLGLVSFCLVIYFQNIKAYNAGMLTILSNRVGDIFLLLLLGWCLNLGTWNLFIYCNYLNIINLKIMGILLILISITKSAQIPFSAWLPAAMAAPTPVSALVHSSTLVTAGVYLLIRFFELMKISLVLNYLLLLGILTMFMSGLSAVCEFDFKKIIALSTLSQLGLMMSTLGMGLKVLSGFHLLTHAFFKALLFLCAGVLIHSFYNFQDIRYMGGFLKYVPIIYSCFIVSNLSLMGMFFLSGFYSKDLILEMMSIGNLNFVIYVLFYICILFTVVYSFRLFFMSFLNYNNFFTLMMFHEEDYFMLIGIFVLTSMSVFMGSVLKWLLNYTVNFIYLYKFMKLMVIYMLLLGLLITLILLNNYYKLKKFFLLFYFNNYMWFLSMMSVYLMNYYFLLSGQKIIKLFDMGWIEVFFKMSLLNIFSVIMKYLMIMQKNSVKIFLMIFIMFIFFSIMFVL